jgi:hypothetical protein
MNWTTVSGSDSSRARRATAATSATITVQKKRSSGPASADTSRRRRRDAAVRRRRTHSNPVRGASWLAVRITRAVEPGRGCAEWTLAVRRRGIRKRAM